MICTATATVLNDDVDVILCILIFQHHFGMFANVQETFEVMELLTNMSNNE